MASMNAVSESWRTLMIGGAVIAALGVLAVIFPFVTGISLSLLLGAVLIVAGAVHVAHAFSAKGWKGVSLQVLLAIVYLVAGIGLMANPLLGLTTLTILLIAYFVADGIVEIVMGLRLRPEANWGWLVVSGALAFVVAGLLIASFPSSALWAVGLLFGVNLLMSGLSMIMVAMNGRNVAREGVSPMAGARGA